MAECTRRPSKTCFVTIGATAGFDALLSAVLETSFLDCLRDYEYTDLLMQYGNEGAAVYDDFVSKSVSEEKPRSGIKVNGFAFNDLGLGQEMRIAKGENGALEGLVISHAGSGSILDALRINVPLVVIPNPKLLDNHQIDLATELAKQGYVVHGNLNDLPTALEASEKLRKEQKEWPPSNSGTVAREKGLESVMAEEMHFLD